MVSSQQRTVGIVVDDPLRRVGLQTILEEGVGLRVRSMALQDAVVVDGLAVVLLDSSCIPNLLDAVGYFHHERPAAKVVVFGGALSPHHIHDLIAAGARGYLCGSASESEIRVAMETVLGGSVWAPRKVLAKLIETGGVGMMPGDSDEHPLDHMTRRELELLALLRGGQTNRQIAEAMGIEQVTVKAHLGRMLRKVGVKNRIELTLRTMAEEQGKA